MVQIALLLFGADFVRTKSKYLWAIGLLWGMLGALVFFDGLDGQLYFPLKTFGFLLMTESIVTLSVASSGVGAQKAVLYFKGLTFLFCALVILINQKYSNVLLSIMFGFSFFIIGIFVGVSAWVVRYPRWQLNIFYSLLQVVFAFFLILHNQAAVSFFLGFLMAASGLNCLFIAIRARRIRHASSVFQLMQPQDTLGYWESTDQERATLAQEPMGLSGDKLVVHIWTPEGSAEHTPVPRPVINRYIAAVDEDGVISTGHAALEVPSQLYISLYPAEDIDRSPSEFFRVLKATRDNDVKGSFQPSYELEAAEWCHSDRRIIFKNYNMASLSAFWQIYSRHEVYNLTYRNCSSSVAYALEAALEGVLSSRGQSWVHTMKIFFMPELWIASQVRKRALMMAWTPGLVMDYARALSAVVHPVARPWSQRMPWKWRYSHQQARSGK